MTANRLPNIAPGQLRRGLSAKRRLATLEASRLLVCKHYW